MRVLVCGSRDFDVPDLICDVLDELAVRCGIECVIDGGAKGADSSASIWAMANGVESVTYLADWKAHGKAAGPIRNQKMLELGEPDLVVAFVNKPLAESKGTAHMVGIARDAGVETHVVRAEVER
jgi:hypothetical protein